MKRKFLFLIFFALGAFSLLAQTLIVREFLISFGGNELGIALFYSFWLLWVGIGALLTLGSLKNILERHFFKLLALYPLLAFLEIILFMLLRHLAGLEWWEFFTLEKALGLLFFLTSFISVFTGILFTLGTIKLKQYHQTYGASSVISFAYAAESIGSFSAGCLVTLLLAKFLSSLIVLALGSFLFALGALIASIRAKDKLSTLLSGFVITCAAISLLASTKLTDFSERMRAAHAFGAGKVIEEIYTPYQHLLLVELPHQKVIITNGEVTSAFPDRISGEEMSALFMSMGPTPENLVVFGYGAENLLYHLLDFPVKNITYVIEDKAYFDTIVPHLPSHYKERFTNNKNLTLNFSSPRLFLKKNKKKFDAAVIHAGAPSNLVSNAFFTEEFYELLAHNLTAKGFIATSLRTAENYIGEEIRNYGSSCYYTLKKVFPDIVIIPQTTTWFFAGKVPAVLAKQPTTLERRYKKIAPAKFSFAPEAFQSLLIKRRMDFVENTYKNNPLFRERPSLVNSDTKPLTYFLSLLVLSRYSNAYLTRIFRETFLVLNNNPQRALGAFIISLLIIISLRIHFLLRIENKRTRRLTLNSKILQFISGFIGLSFHLILITLFQSRFGTIFLLIGFVNSLFMLGLCTGGILGKVCLQKVDAIKSVSAVIVLQIITLLASLLFFINMAIPNNIAFVLFIMFFLIGGIITGSSYPLAAAILKKQNTPLKTIAASLELLDHWGGALAGILAGLLFLPLLGITNSLLLLVCLALFLLIIFIAELLPGLTGQEKTPGQLSFPYIRLSYILVGLALVSLINVHFLQREPRQLGPQELLLAPADKDNCTLIDAKTEGGFKYYTCKEADARYYILQTADCAPEVTGFASHINLKVTLTEDGIIKDIEVLQHQETSFYVTTMPTFINQFKGRSIKEDFLLAELDTMSGATTSSAAITESLNRTAQKFNQYIMQQGRSRKETKKSFNRAAFALLLFSALALSLYTLFPFAQKARKIYLFLVVIFLGFTFNLQFSSLHLANIFTLSFPPVWSMQGALIYGLPLLFGLLFGQFYCGWLCPFGALQELLGGSRCSLKISKKLDQKARYVKYLLLFAFVLAVTFGGKNTIFRQDPLSVTFFKPLEFMTEKALAVFVLFLSIYFLRFWCRYFCVCGAFLSLFNKFAIFRKLFTKRYADCPLDVQGSHDVDCIQCNLCMKK